MKRLEFFALLYGCLMLVGCSSAPISFDRTPPPDVLMATVAALQTENVRLATQVAGLPATIEHWPTATPSPSSTPTATATPTATSTRAVARRAAPAVTPAWPKVLWLTTDQREVNPGDSVTLRWDTENATRALIRQFSASSADYGEISVAPDGSIVLPITDQERSSHTFVLKAYNAAGDSTSGSVSVYIRCPYTYFFSMPADKYRWDCPAGPATTSDAAEQYFEGGRMIWLGTEKAIYVLLNDGGLYTYADTWTEGQPDVDPGITPPAGRYKPVRGFGRVWGSDPYIRSRLGWAMAPEQGYQVQLQRSWTCCSSATNALYLREVDNRVIHLWPGQTSHGRWEFTQF